MGGNVINRVFESAGPDGKVRGTPQQIIDKYQALARDAQLTGDRVVAESYLQHSEHYSRLLGEAQRQQMEQRSNQQERDDFQRDDASRQDGQQRSEFQRDEGSRQDGQQRNDWQQQQPRGDGNRAEDGGRRQGGSQESSGLTTIDPRDSEDMADPVETPEGRRRRPREDAIERPAGAGGEAQAAGSEEAPAPPAKRPRTRRKAKADPDSAGADAQAE